MQVDTPPGASNAASRLHAWGLCTQTPGVHAIDRVIHTRRHIGLFASSGACKVQTSLELPARDGIGYDRDSECTLVLHYERYSECTLVLEQYVLRHM